jgi:hypothetical protein
MQKPAMKNNCIKKLYLLKTVKVAVYDEQMGTALWCQLFPIEIIYREKKIRETYSTKNQNAPVFATKMYLDELL